MKKCPYIPVDIKNATNKLTIIEEYSEFLKSTMDGRDYDERTTRKHFYRIFGVFIPVSYGWEQSKLSRTLNQKNIYEREFYAPAQELTQKEQWKQEKKMKKETLALDVESQDEFEEQE